MKALQEYTKNRTSLHYYESTSLKAKLSMINIQPTSIQDGKIKSTISLYSSLDCYVTDVSVNIGQFVNPTDVMFRLVNLEHIHAELQVYEKDIEKIQIGQKVTLALGNEKQNREATVYLIGKEITPDRTVLVHCHLTREDERLLPGAFITATIETHTKSVSAIPNSAIVNFDGTNFVFVSEGSNRFQLVAVKTGEGSKEFTEIQLDDAIIKNNAIVVKGAFELLGLLKNNEE